MSFPSLSAADDAYMNVVLFSGTTRSIKAGPERDALLLPLSCVPILAYDNHGLSYPIWIGPSRYEGQGDVMHVIGAPSGWSIATLREGRADGRYLDSIAFDAGQGWMFVNFNEVWQAVTAMLDEQADIDMFDNSSFYPTPPLLASRMTSLVNGTPRRVLEPSAANAPLHCHHCDAEVADVDTAIEEGWVPYFWDETIDDYCLSPVCSTCFVNLGIIIDQNGEWCRPVAVQS